MVAAVADWRVEISPTKLKKDDGPPKLKFVPNPRHSRRDFGRTRSGPRLVIGFAAETEQRGRERHRQAASARRADWIVANDVSGDVMGGHRNRVHLVTADGVEDWPEDSKEEVARHLIRRVAQEIG